MLFRPNRGMIVAETEAAQAAPGPEGAEKEEPVMRLFDTHAHYDSGAFNSDRLGTLAAMPEQGVELILNPGCDLESSRTAIALAEEFPFVYAAVGVHPSDCGAWEDSWLEQLRALAAHPKVRAIGEIGLDYYWKDNPPENFSRRCLPGSWSWRRSWTCRSSSMTGRPTRTAWRWFGPIRRSVACTTATPGVWRTPRCW